MPRGSERGGIAGLSTEAVQACPGGIKVLSETCTKWCLTLSSRTPVLPCTIGVTPSDYSKREQGLRNTEFMEILTGLGRFFCLEARGSLNISAIMPL